MEFCPPNLPQLTKIRNIYLHSLELILMNRLYHRIANSLIIIHSLMEVSTALKDVLLAIFEDYENPLSQLSLQLGTYGLEVWF